MLASATKGGIPYHALHVELGRSLSSLESDGVDRSRCTGVFCSGVYFLDSVH